MRHGDLATTAARLARHHAVALVMVLATMLYACATHPAAPPARSPVAIGVTPTASLMPSPTPRPATTGATMIYAAADMRPSALDAATGAVHWQCALTAGDPATFAGSTLYVATADAHRAMTMLALDARTSSTRWSLPFALGLPPTAIAANDTMVFVLHSDVKNGYLLGRLLSGLAAGDGHLVWQHDFGYAGISDPILAGGLVYMLSSDALDFLSDRPADVTISAFDVRTGATRWTHAITGGFQNWAVGNGQVYLDGASTVYAFDGQTGFERFRTFAPYLGQVLTASLGAVYTCKTVTSYGDPVAAPHVHDEHHGAHRGYPLAEADLGRVRGLTAGHSGGGPAAGCWRAGHR